MANEFKHKDAGIALTQAEDNATDRHEADSQVAGDVLYCDSSYWKRLPKGTDGDFLTSGTTPSWTTHASVLDAHIKSFMEIIRTGQYFLPSPRGLRDTLTLVADTIYAVPFIVTRNLTIDRLAIHVRTASAGDEARLGIYENGTNLYPLDLVRDYGLVSVNATGIVAASASQALTKGRYWVVVVSDGTPNLEALYSTFAPLGQSATDFSNTRQYEGWSKASVGFGALADPFVSSAAVFYGKCPSLLPRLESLD